MTKQERKRWEQLDRALDIAADLFFQAGCDVPNGDGGPASIRRWLIRQAGRELKEERSRAL